MHFFLQRDIFGTTALIRPPDAHTGRDLWMPDKHQRKQSPKDSLPTFNCVIPLPVSLSGQRVEGGTMPAAKFNPTHPPPCKTIPVVRRPREAHSHQAAPGRSVGSRGSVRCWSGTATSSRPPHTFKTLYSKSLPIEAMAPPRDPTTTTTPTPKQEASPLLGGLLIIQPVCNWSGAVTDPGSES